MTRFPEAFKAAVHGLERMPGPWHHEASKTPTQKVYDHVRYLIKNVDRLKEFLIIEANQNDFLFTAYIFESKGRKRKIVPILIREDDAYAVLNDVGRRPDKFSWDPTQEIKIGGETFRTAVHAIEGNKRSVFLESSRFEPGKRTGIRISIAEKTPYYDALLKNPITSPEDKELAQPFTLLSHPLAGVPR